MDCEITCEEFYGDDPVELQAEISEEEVNLELQVAADAQREQELSNAVVEE